MIDKDYIAELKALEDQKEAKAKLVEYAEQFDIKVKKTKSFDNIVLDIEEALRALADEPMPETVGLSINDLITAADDAEGLNDTNEEVNPEASLLIDSPVGEYQVEIIEQLEPSVEPVTDEITKTRLVEENIPFVEEKFEEAIKAVVESEKTFTLPDNFSPNLNLIGRNPGFCTVPWWIYQWISETPDWKERPTSFQHPSAHQTLFSLIYYISRDGSVLIRETRNSSFVTLK